MWLYFQVEKCYLLELKKNHLKIRNKKVSLQTLMKSEISWTRIDHVIRLLNDIKISETFLQLKQYHVF